MLLKMTNLLSSTAPSPHIHGSSANVHHHFVRKNSTTAFVGRVLFAANLNALYIYKRQWMLWKVHDVDKSRNNVLQTKWAKRVSKQQWAKTHRKSWCIDHCNDTLWFTSCSITTTDSMGLRTKLSTRNVLFSSPHRQKRLSFSNLYELRFLEHHAIF